MPDNKVECPATGSPVAIGHRTKTNYIENIYS